MDTNQIRDFYRVPSKDKNFFSQYERIIRLYGGTFKNPKWLPTKKYVLPDGIRKPIPLPPPMKFSYKWELKEHQAHIVNTAFKRAEPPYNYGCGLIELGTGKGKSHVMMGLIDKFKVPTLILVHNLKTLQEMIAKIEEFCWAKAAQYGGGKKQIGWVTVCTKSSFDPDTFQGKFQMILIDEVDHWMSDKFIETLAEYDVPLVYALSGTPFTKDLDRSDMEKAFWKLIIAPTPKYDMTPDIVCYRYGKLPELMYKDFAEHKTLLVQDKDRLAAQIAQIKTLVNTRQAILILTERREEASLYKEHLSEFMPALITWETAVNEDNEELERVLALPSGRIIIGTAGKMARGVDIPPIDTVCIFCALHFEWALVQAVGRTLRVHPWKQKPLVVDWSDGSMIKQFYSRKQSYYKEYGNDTLIKEYHIPVWTTLPQSSRPAARKRRAISNTAEA